MAETRPETKRIDWAAAHRRIDAALRRVEADMAPDAAARILRERAEEYARVVETAAAGEMLGLLGFSAGADRFAVDLGYCDAVAPLQDVCPVPGLPDMYLGLISYRGHIYPAIDLRALAGGRDAGAAADALRFAVLVRHDAAALAIATSEIAGIRETPVAAVARPDSGPREGGDIVAGVLDGGTMLIDVARLLVDFRLQVDVEPEFTAPVEEASR